MSTVPVSLATGNSRRKYVSSRRWIGTEPSQRHLGAAQR